MTRLVVVLLVLVAGCAPRLRPGWIVSSPTCRRWEVVLLEGMDMQTGEPRTLHVVQCAERIPKKETP